MDKHSSLFSELSLTKAKSFITWYLVSMVLDLSLVLSARQNKLKCLLMVLLTNIRLCHGQTLQRIFRIAIKFRNNIHTWCKCYQPSLWYKKLDKVSQNICPWSCSQILDYVMDKHSSLFSELPLLKAKSLITWYLVSMVLSHSMVLRAQQNKLGCLSMVLLTNIRLCHGQTL